MITVHNFFQGRGIVSRLNSYQINNISVPEAGKSMKNELESMSCLLDFLLSDRNDVDIIVGSVHINVSTYPTNFQVSPDFVIRKTSCIVISSMTMPPWQPNSEMFCFSIFVFIHVKFA